jgi:two-component system, OmpR family, sensor histidine kinase ChvG
MTLRTKLLLLSLLTLILPWAGWRYAQQMEVTLRQGQEMALLTTADVLGRVVASEPELLYRARELSTDFDPSQGDLFAPLLPTAPLIDGFADEWPVPSRPVPGFSDADPPKNPKLRLGVYGRSMHLYAQVQTANVVYEVPSHAEFAQKAAYDRLIILIRDEFDREWAWSLSAVAPGPLIVRRSEIGMPWRSTDEDVPNVAGVWRETSDGYAVELRAPINLFGTQLAAYALDDRNEVIAQTPSLAAVHTGSELLKSRLERYAPVGTQVSVVDTHGWLLARAGSISVNAQADYAGLRRDQHGFSRSIYRVLFSRDEARPHSYGLPYGMWGTPVDEARAGKETAVWFDQAGGYPSLIRAAVPVQLEGQAYGALLVEQPGEQLALVREIALTRLLNLTLVATLFTIVITLMFAARLSHRIRRLSRAASTALTPEGRIEPAIPDMNARDELGALARNYGTLLTRLKEYTSYLQTLGTKLSHELRTPLTIVSSSLDNLASEEKLPDTAQSYLDRARQGASRMHGILSALSEATRVEQSIEHTERVRFDISELVRNMALAYRHTFSEHRIEQEVLLESCHVVGSPDLIAQLLDKLMDNAADFTPAGAPITIRLEGDARVCRLSVQNEGPGLPPDLDGRLFESLVSGRASAEGKPHLGLGLYVVRLIADFHGGSVRAENAADGSGVVITLELERSG